MIDLENIRHLKLKSRDTYFTVKIIVKHFSEKSYNTSKYGYTSFKVMKRQNYKIAKLHHSYVK